MKYLAGCILVNPKTSAAILVNSIEVYARSSLIVAHHERSVGKKAVPPMTTNAPSNIRYPNVRAISMEDADSCKLNIATQTFNGLITSSIRTDNPYRGSRPAPCLTHNALDLRYLILLLSTTLIPVNLNCSSCR